MVTSQIRFLCTAAGTPSLWSQPRDGAVLHSYSVAFSRMSCKQNHPVICRLLVWLLSLGTTPLSLIHAAEFIHSWVFFYCWVVFHCISLQITSSIHQLKDICVGKCDFSYLNDTPTYRYTKPYAQSSLVLKFLVPPQNFFLAIPAARELNPGSNLFHSSNLSHCRDITGFLTHSLSHMETPRISLYITHLPNMYICTDIGYICLKLSTNMQCVLLVV